MRVYTLGMPQMALGALSENWLLKELGSIHWDALCRSLRTESQNLTDAHGRRLYATFVRVKLDLDDSLAAFEEGSTLKIEASTSRYGRSTAISICDLSNESSAGQATMMTTFSFREHDNNKAMAKSEPKSDYDNSIVALDDPPPFFTEYSDIRRAYGRAKLAKAENTYQINPFVDSNGANLLYFAAYQSIHDVLARKPGHTKSRDICYFRNSGLDDQIAIQGDMLFRVSDGEALAHVTATKI